jgi:hypothetical protein
VTVIIPAGAPFAALRLTGITRPGARPRPGRDHGRRELAAYPVTLQSLEFTGAASAPVALGQYEAAVPDPLRHAEPAVLHHLEHCHMAELVRCVQAHGITTAEYVIPRGLDRFGLEILVLAASGVAAVRLAFPNGPVASLLEVPAGTRAVLTCRCDDGAREH